MARFSKRKRDDDPESEGSGEDPENEGSGDVEKRSRRKRPGASARRRGRRREQAPEETTTKSSAGEDAPDADEQPTAADERRRKRRRGDAAAAATPTSSGNRSPVAAAKATAAKILDPIHKAFVTVLAILGALLVGLYGIFRAVVNKLAPPAKAIGKRVVALLQALSRLLTPARGLLVAAIACAVLLALSQFADYRGISIGADVYDPGISSVAPAPEVERAEAGSAHSYLFVPVAIVAIALLLVAARTRRWQLCRLVTLIGLAAIVIALIVDRSAGLDLGTLDRDFTGVEARLLGGFWMQMFAGAGLALTSFLLAGELRREAAARAGQPLPSRESKQERGRFTRKSSGGDATEGAKA